MSSMNHVVHVNNPVKCWFYNVRRMFNLRRAIRSYKYKNALRNSLPNLANSNITNLSDHKLKLNEKKILNKRLYFIYCNKQKNLTTFNMSKLDEFERKLQIKLNFFNT